MITDEIKRTIETQLPAMVGDVLKQRLAQADALEKELAATKLSEKNYRERCEQLTVRIASDDAATAKLKEIEKRETAMAQREMECRLNEVRLECVKERVTDLKEVTLQVFANARFKYSELSTVPVGLPGIAAGPGGYPTSPRVETATATREVTAEG